MSGAYHSSLAFRYRLDRMIRAVVMRVMGWLTPGTTERRVDLLREDVKTILLVRGIFRMGDSILATPAIPLFRENFPTARIDFVGPVLSKALFKDLPLDHHYDVYRSFPKVLWTYVAPLKRIRSGSYDLAVDVSGSNSAMGACIVGFSGARFCGGLRGKCDRWFNLRFPRPAEKNKYGNLSELIGSMGLKTKGVFPTLILSSKEKKQGHSRLQTIVGGGGGPVVGIFVGGRKTRGKRWRKENFIEIASRLRTEKIRPIIFVGPEEKELIGYFEEVLRERIPVVFEPNLREFASLVAACDLFVACDSGPVHLACALRVRTVAICLQRNFDRWGPPVSLGRIVYGKSGVSAKDAIDACCCELWTLRSDDAPRKLVNA